VIQQNVAKEITSQSTNLQIGALLSKAKKIAIIIFQK
jgi:hypothetical protein